MRQGRSCQLVLLAAIAWALGMVQPAHAVFPRRPGPPPAATGHTVYAPETEHYLVVDPTPWQEPVGKPRSMPHTWPAQELQAPVYPYGWFGARVYPQRNRHVGYFENYVDTIRLRIR